MMPLFSARHGRSTRVLGLAIALPVLLGSLIGAPAPTANAATGSVTINTIGTRTTPYKGTYQLKSSYSTSGQVRVSKATVTVAKGSKTIAKRVSSVRLPAGKYTVTQEVTYQRYTNQTRQEAIVAVDSWVDPYWATPVYAYGCTITDVITQDADHGTWRASCGIRDSATITEIGSVDTAGTWASGDDSQVLWLNERGDTVYPAWAPPSVNYYFTPQASIKALTAITKPVTTKVYETATTVSKTQTLTVKAGPKDCATYADYKKVKAIKKIKRGDSLKTVAHKLFSKGIRYESEEVSGHTVEVRVYKGCSNGKIVAVGFIDGRAYNKGYGSE